MFQPTDYSVGVLFALVALACWGSWSTTLVLASKTMPWECFYFDWAVSFLLTGVVVGLIIGSIPADGGHNSNFYIEELFSYTSGCYCYSITGGILWNVANILVGKAIGLMGQALGFPMSVGIGLVSGSITNYIIDRKGTNLGLLLLGDFIACGGICTVGLLANRKEEEQARLRPMMNVDPEVSTDHIFEVSLARKFTICLFGGLLLGLSNIGVVNATSGSCLMSAPANQTFFSLGVFVSSMVLVPVSVLIPVEGGAAKTTLAKLAVDYKKVGGKEHALGALGGFLLCMGFFAYNLGNATELGSAPTYSIGQSAPVVGLLWGTLFFKEFHGMTFKTLQCNCIMADIYYVPQAAFEALQKKMSKKKVVFTDLVALTHPMDADDEDVMLPVDMRGLGIDIDDVDDIAEKLGPNGTVAAFAKARKYFEENQGKDPDEGRPQPISGKEFKKMMMEDMDKEEAEEPSAKKAKTE